MFCKHFSFQSILANLLVETFIHSIFQIPVSLKQPFFIIFWKGSNVFVITQIVITFQQVFCSWYKNEFRLLLANCTERSPCWEYNQFSASQEIPRILRKPKFPYRIYKCPRTYSILSQSIQSMLPHSNSYLNVKLPLTPGSTKWSLSRMFPHQTQYEPLISPVRAAWPHVLDTFTRKILGEECITLNSSLRSFSTPWLPRPS